MQVLGISSTGRRLTKSLLTDPPRASSFNVTVAGPQPYRSKVPGSPVVVAATIEVRAPGLTGDLGWTPTSDPPVQFTSKR